MKFKLKLKNQIKFKVGIGTMFRGSTGMIYTIHGFSGSFKDGDRLMMGDDNSTWTVTYLFNQFNLGNFQYLKGADGDYEIPSKFKQKAQS